MTGASLAPCDPSATPANVVEQWKKMIEAGGLASERPAPHRIEPADKWEARRWHSQGYPDAKRGEHPGSLICPETANT
jgi:hypothetical protein